MNALWTPPETVSVYSDSTLGCAGSDVSRNTMPFLRFDAPSRLSTPILPSAETLTSFRMRASKLSASTFTGAEGVVMLYTHSLPESAEVAYR